MESEDNRVPGRRFPVLKLTALFVAIALLGGLTLFLRGPYVSNFLKMTILSEVSSATGQQVIASKLYMNLYPLSVEARGVKGFALDGTRLFSAERVKAYIGLSDILQRKLRFTRIVLVRPELQADDARLVEVSDNVKTYKKGKRGLVSISADTINILHGSASIHQLKTNTIQSASEINAEIVLRKQPEARFSVGHLDALFGGQRRIQASAKGYAVFDGGQVVLKEFEIESNKARLSATGTYQKGDKGVFEVKASVPVSSLRDLFALTRPTDGSIELAGSVRLDGDRFNPTLDMKVKGSIYLETFMEFFGPQKEEPIKGYAAFDGTIKGPLKALKGDGRARLLKGGGGFYGVNVQSAECRVTYTPQRLSFLDGKVSLYNGRADADVWLQMPHIDTFGMKIKYEDVDSRPIFGLIGLDGIGLPGGKVRGELASDSREFDPSGWVIYNATESGANAVERVRSLDGRYSVAGQTVTISSADVRTARSHAAFDGTFMLDTKALNFRTRLQSEDISELTAPFYNGVRGGATYAGTLTGTSDDPHFKAHIESADLSVGAYRVGGASVDAEYGKHLLVISHAEAGDGQRRYDGSGKISFPGAKEILQIDDGVYDLTVGLHRADLRGLAALFGVRTTSFGGNLDTTLTVHGRGAYPEVSGQLGVSDGDILGRAVPTASAALYYDRRSLRVENGLLGREGAMVVFSGSIDSADRLEFKASSAAIPAKFLFLTPEPVEQKISFNATGGGTLKEPEMKVAARLDNGELAGMQMPGGEAELTVRGGEAAFSASLNNGSLKVNGKASLTADLPWSAEVSSTNGRYDFLSGLFMKDIPEDLMISLGGTAELKGTRDSIGGRVLIKDVNVSMYGQSFGNAGDIAIALDGDRLDFSSFKLRAGALTLTVSGGTRIGKDYDLTLEGRSQLAPFKPLIPKIEDLRGTGEFSIRVKGPWREPSLNGRLTLNDATLALKGLNQRLTSLNGACLFDGSRIVFQGVSGKVGGGDVSIGGYVGIKGIAIEQAYINMKVSQVTALVAKGFVVTFDGNVLYRDTGGGDRDITGDIVISRARYTERLEWKSWLIAARKLESPEIEKTWADQIKLNLRVFGDRTITVENNIVRTALKMDIRFLGTIGEPLLFGRIEANDGKVYFRNSEFQINNITADYSNTRGADPYITVLAETLVKGYRVKLNLEGRLDKFDLILASDPPLDEVQILSLLTLGRFGDNLRGLEGGIGAAEATSFVTGHLQDTVEEKLKDITGIDRVDVEPYVAGTTQSPSSASTVTPRVTVSKELVNNKLFVTYAAPIGAAQEQSLLLEYMINNSVSVQGGRDELGSAGGDLKFRFKFK